MKLLFLSGIPIYSHEKISYTVHYHIMSIVSSSSSKDMKLLLNAEAEVTTADRMLHEGFQQELHQ